MRIKKGLGFVLAAVMAVTAVSACGSPQAASSSGNAAGGGTNQTATSAAAGSKYGMKQLQIATASQGGGFYTLGAALAPVLEKSLGMPVLATTSQGSQENIALLQRGEVPMTMVTGSILYESWAGTSSFKKPYQDDRLLFGFYPSNAFIYTRANSGITSISQLIGKRVGMGTDAATWNMFTLPLLEASGLKLSDFKPVYGSFDDLSNQVGDGTLDAALGLETTPAIYQLAEQKGIRVLLLTDDAIQKLTTQNGTWWYYNASTMKQSQLPKGSWNQPEFKTVMWMGPYLVANKNLPDDLAYDIVKTIYQNLDQLNKSSNLYRWAAADPKVLTTPLKDMQWSPGAVKFWKEAGLWQGN